MVGTGQIAVIRFTGRVAEGENAGAVFDATDPDVARAAGVYRDDRDYEPLAFRVGDGAVVEGLEAAVREMTVGEERTVRLDPERAFGAYDDDRVVELSRRDLDARGDLTVESNGLVRTGDGDTGWITDADDRRVTVDFNHELAGVAVEFDVELLDVRDD